MARMGKKKKKKKKKNKTWDGTYLEFGYGTTPPAKKPTPTREEKPPRRHFMDNSGIDYIDSNGHTRWPGETLYGDDK